MHCIDHPTFAEFLRVCEEFLLRHESEHNLILGTRVEADSNLVSIHTENSVVGAAVLHATERSLLSKMDEAAIHTLIDFINERNILFESMVGPIESSECFVESWRTSNAIGAKLLLHTGVYELSEVRFPEMDGRSLIPMDAVKRDVAFQYLLGFLADCFPEMDDPKSAARKLLDRHSQNRTLFFRQGPDDSAPVSMAARARQSRNGATISLVYTPPGLRRQGHASRMVAALSDRCLREGKKFCSLFADLKNPTSNAIYQEIGYRKIGESKHFKFLWP